MNNQLQIKNNQRKLKKNYERKINKKSTKNQQKINKKSTKNLM